MKEKNFREIESYPIISLKTENEELSFAKVQIMAAPNELYYKLDETEMDSGEREIYYRIISKLKETDSEKNMLKMTKVSVINFISQLLKRDGIREGYPLKKLFYFIYKNYAGFGKIDSLLQDSELKYIFCEGIGFPVYVYHTNPKYGFLKTNVVIKSISEFEIISENLKLKSRALRNDDDFLGVLYNTHLVEISGKNKEFSIKKTSRLPVVPKDLVQLNIAKPQMVAYLNNAINKKASVLIIGGNPVQRTELINSFAMMVKKNTKTVSFENRPRLIIPQERWYSKVLKPYKKNKNLVIEDYLRKKPEFVIADGIKELKQIIKNIRKGCQTFISFESQTFDEVMNHLNKTIPAPTIAFIDIIVVLSNEKEDWPEITEVYELHSFDLKTKKIQVRPVFYVDPVQNKRIIGKSKLFN